MHMMHSWLAQLAWITPNASGIGIRHCLATTSLTGFFEAKLKIQPKWFPLLRLYRLRQLSVSQSMVSKRQPVNQNE